MAFNAEIIAAGLFISFSGSLPFGNLNVTAMHIAAHEGIRKAAWFALGVATTEIIYLRLTLYGIGWITVHRDLFTSLQWLTVAFLSAMAVSSFLAARKKMKARNVLIENDMPGFLLSLMMSTVNPLQFPFWAGWVIALTGMHILHDREIDYDFFTASAGAGTFIALLLFIFLGKKLSVWIKANHASAQLVMGTFFALMAVYQLITIL